MEGRREVYTKQRREIECTVHCYHQPQLVLSEGRGEEREGRIVLPIDSKERELWGFLTEDKTYLTKDILKELK